MNSWLDLLVPALVSLSVVGAGYLANRKLGITEGQKTLVKTLQDTVDAQQDELARIGRSEGECKRRLDSAEEHVSRLQAEVFELRTFITSELVKIRREGLSPGSRSAARTAPRLPTRRGRS